MTPRTSGQPACGRSDAGRASRKLDASGRDSWPASAILDLLKYGDDAPIPDPYLLPTGAPPTPPAEQPPGNPRSAPPTPPSGYAAKPFAAVPESPYATWALVIGVFGLICFGAGPVLGMIAVVLGVIGWRQVSKAGGGLRGKFSAAAGILTGILAIGLFAGEVALYLTLVRPQRIAAGTSVKTQEPSAAVSSTADDDSSSAAGSNPTEPPSGASVVTTVGHITVVDVALGVASLSNELRRQHAEATANGEKLLLETTATGCPQCQGIASSLPDPRMQNALDHVRLVRVDRDPFEEDLAELEIPSRPLPGFFLLDSDLRVTDAINGGEWDEDIAVNIAPVIGPFVRGTYAKRRSPWKKLPRPGGTVL